MGGGLAGLVAAHRLRALGLQTTLLEARAQTGGRLVRETLDGFDFELAPSVLPACAPSLGGLVAELGATASVRREPLHQVLRLRSGRLELASTRADAALARTPLRGLRRRRLHTLVDWLGADLDARAPERETRLDDRSVADFSRVYLGRRAGPRLLAPLLETAFGLDAGETSRLLLFLLMGAWGDVELAQATGLAALPEALVKGLDDVRTDTRAAALLPHGRGVRVERGSELAADAVVLAVSPREAARLVPDLAPAERAALESSRAATILHLVVSVSGYPESRAPAIVIPVSEGGTLAGVLEATPQRGAGPGLLRLVARADFAARHAASTDEELVAALLGSAERVLPGLGASIRERRLLRRDDALPCFPPGRYRALERLRLEQRQRPERRVFLAGDWLVGPHAEAAVASGERAALEAYAAVRDE